MILTLTSFLPNLRHNIVDFKIQVADMPLLARTFFGINHRLFHITHSPVGVSDSPSRASWGRLLKTDGEGDVPISRVTVLREFLRYSSYELWTWMAVRRGLQGMMKQYRERGSRHWNPSIITASPDIATYVRRWEYVKEWNKPKATKTNVSHFETGSRRS